MASDEEPKGAAKADAEIEPELAGEESARAEVAYEVGYGKPPRHTRFKPGESGNARGRPKGAKNVKTYLLNALNEKVVVREGGRSRKITKLEAFVTAVINGSIKGNSKFAVLLMNTLIRYVDTGNSEGAGEEELSNEDLEVLRAQEERLLRRLVANQTPDPTPADESEAAEETREDES